MKKIEWEKYLTLDKTFAIDSVIYSEDFNHSKFVAYRTKDAIVDYFMEKCQDTINYIRFLWCIGNEEMEKCTYEDCVSLEKFDSYLN